MNEQPKIPFAEFLEETLSTLVEFPVDAIAIMVKYDNGDVGCNYCNCSIDDKIRFAGYIQHDAMIDTVRVNKQRILGQEDEE